MSEKEERIASQQYCKILLDKIKELESEQVLHIGHLKDEFGKLYNEIKKENEELKFKLKITGEQLAEAYADLEFIEEMVRDQQRHFYAHNNTGFAYLTWEQKYKEQLKKIRGEKC